MKHNLKNTKAVWCIIDSNNKILDRFRLKSTAVGNLVRVQKGYPDLLRVVHIDEVVVPKKR